MRKGRKFRKKPRKDRKVEREGAEKERKNDFRSLLLIKGI